VDSGGAGETTTTSGGRPGSAGTTGGAAAGTGGAAPATAALSGTTGKDFGNVEVGVASTTFTWTILNTGGVPAGNLALQNNNPTEVTATNNCAATLAAGASCTVVVSIKPSAGGARAATLTLTGSPGGSVTLALSAKGQLRVSVTLNGVGTVTSTPAGISCGTTCSMLVSQGTAVTLQARTTNGSNAFFSGWGGGCSSPARDCTLTVSASVSVAASFPTMTNNLIFVSSTIVPVNKGSAIAYDAVCNSAATAAGINTAAGNGYIAFISDAASLASSRMPTSARGWVRMDGKPFADTLASLLTDHKVFNSVSFREDGLEDTSLLLTGMNQEGGLGTDTCKNWTSTSMNDYGNVGTAMGGPGAWVFWYSTTLCSYTATEFPMHLICMGTTKSAAVVPLVTSGKRIWVTSTPFSPGGSQTPDAKCQGDRPTGVTTAVALISTSTKAASSLLTPTASYVRMDGTLVGTGAELAAGPTKIASGIWQSADGVYRAQLSSTSFPRTWTGSATIGSVGTADSTCGDWTSGDAAKSGFVGEWTLDYNNWWHVYTTACNTGQTLYCVQTAP